VPAYSSFFESCSSFCNTGGASWVAENGYDVVSREEVQMVKRIAALLVVCGAFLAFAAPAAGFAVVHPVREECRQVLIPGAAFPGNFEVVDANPTEAPGPWNAHTTVPEHTALHEEALCPK
jgi:hypothetical protein